MQDSPDEIIKVVENWKHGLKIAMFASGITTWDQAKGLHLS
jgi:isopentenyl diphosphate isomerase/L-lactate dehydrogenase-like FMN-dependent dehydrogenase